MCILLTAWHEHPRYDLVVAANRDEFHARPTAPAAPWAEIPQIVAGRDLEAGGTWLGVTQGGRFAAVTNLRQPGHAAGSRSRGLLVPAWLQSEAVAGEHSGRLAAAADEYAGVNHLFGDRRSLCAWSNQDNRVRELEAGLHGVSNAVLGVEWPKVTRLKRAYMRYRALADEALIEALLAALRDDTRAVDDELPDTGISPADERRLSSIFIDGDYYGTRCSSVVLREPGGRTLFVERRYDALGRAHGDSRYELAG